MGLANDRHSSSNDGEALPTGTLIFRIGKNVHLSPMALEKRIALPEMFELSSSDKKSTGQRLSVWVEELTIADQGWAFMGSNPANTVVACLRVDDIRAIVSPLGMAPLDVYWEKAFTNDEHGNAIPNTLPGAEGHAGISNLNQGGNSKPARDGRKFVRMKLADMATISPVPVPHDFPEEEIRTAAYFLYKNNEINGCHDLNWTNATRQLRREFVRKANVKP